MPEAHSQFRGKLIRLSDESIEDFTGDVNTVRVLHEANGIGPNSLSEHADDVRHIAHELEVSYVGADKQHHIDGLWPAFVALAVDDQENGDEFLDAHGYVRVNRILNAEFGPAENDTTKLLRDISLNHIRNRRQLLGKEDIVNLYDIYLGSEVMSQVYQSGSTDTHPEIEKHIYEAAYKEDTENPALARIVSTLVSRSCSVIYNIDDEYVSELLRSNFSTLRSTKLQTKPVKEKIISWVEDPKAKKSSNEFFEHTDDEAEEDDEDDQPRVVEMDFNYRNAACYIDKDLVNDPKLYDALREHVTRIMFPLRGESTKPAKEVCDSCSEKDDCLDYAIKNGIKHGIWGGESERGRREIRKALRLENEDETE